jgi:hypothetical protein
LRRFYVMSQIEYWHNFIFRQNFPIRILFQRSCELGLFTLTANKVSNMFGTRITQGFKGKLQVVLERLDQAHHTLRAYFKNSFVKQSVDGVVRFFIKTSWLLTNFPNTQ